MHNHLTFSENVKIQFAPQVRRHGGSVELTCLYRGYPPPKVIWYKQKAPIDPSDKGEMVCIDETKIC